MTGKEYWPRSLLAAGTALLATACAGPGSADAGRLETGANDSIAMEVKSWGHPVFRWSVDQAGRGIFVEARRVPGGGFGDYDLLSQSIDAGPEGYARMQTILQPLAGYAGRDLPCTSRATDLPYGSVSWTTSGATKALSFDTGCDPTGAEDAYRALGKARDLVRSWVAQATSTKVEEVRASNR